jgi:ribosome biogenesis GTPase
VAVSVVSGEGLEALTAALRGRVTVVAGPSGAGKSSIINALRLRSRGLESGLGAMHAEPSGAAPDSDSEEDEGDFDEDGCGGDGSEAAAGEQRAQDGAQPPAEAQQRDGDRGAAAQRHRRQGGSAADSAGHPPQVLPAGLELQAVGQVSARIGRGKHTTRNVTLLELEGSGGGLVVDTPGFNQPSLSMPATELGQHFPEIRRLTEEQRCVRGR